MILLCYPKCGTCKKAEAFLKANGIEYTYRDISVENPTVEELKEWQPKSGLPLKRFFNTSGMLYREGGYSKKLPDMSEGEIFALLATNGMLVKRPICLTDDGKVLVGFKQAEWEEALL